MPEIQPVLRFKPELSMSINAWFGIIAKTDTRLAKLAEDKREFTASGNYDLKHLMNKNIAINHTASIKPLARWMITKLLIDTDKTKELIEANRNV